MANLDFKALRSKLTQLKERAKKGKNVMWKPKTGDNLIRIVPLMDNLKNPFIELNIYFKFNGKNFLSPTSTGDPDPICEFVDKIKTQGSKDEYLEARKMLPKFRCYVPIIVRGQEEEGVKFWSFGKQVYEQLLSVMTDADYGEVNDLKEGRDLVVKYVPPSPGDYGSTTIVFKPNTTIASNNPQVIEAIKENSKTEVLMSGFTQMNYDQLSVELQTYLSAGIDDSSEEEGSEEEKSEYMKKQFEKSSSKKTDEEIDPEVQKQLDDFDAMLEAKPKNKGKKDAAKKFREMYQEED